MADYRVAYLDQLEAESIQIFRETAASFERPIMLYSIGKDSSVLLHLAQKSFFPGKLPFSLLHIDTTYKFREMISFRDNYVRGELGVEVIVHTNDEGIRSGINPFDHGSKNYTDVMKTDALKQALTKGKYDGAIGGARRDEEASRSKERVFSFRDEQYGWDPRRQRPEMWQRPNTRLNAGESMRVFPLSNWTEIDIWLYIRREEIPVVPLYYAAQRPVVERDGSLIMVDDGRLPLSPAEKPVERMVRFRTLGCYPLTGAVESTATTVDEVIYELVNTTYSERKDRRIDSDQAGSMEEKKKVGYF